MADWLRMYHAISSRFTQSILAIAVAQLPPPITANFGISVISVGFEKSKILNFNRIGKLKHFALAQIEKESLAY